MVSGREGRHGADATYLPAAGRGAHIQVGDLVEEFAAVDQQGKEVRLSDLRSRGSVVLFFYPKAMSPGCTKQTCHFRDLAAEFAASGATAVGVSADSTEDQARFDAAHGLGMPLLSDPDRVVARQFGVTRPGPLPPRRATFVIAADGRLLEEIRSETLMAKHADRALAALRADRT